MTLGLHRKLSRTTANLLASHPKVTTVVPVTTYNGVALHRVYIFTKVTEYKVYERQFVSSKNKNKSMRVAGRKCAVTRKNTDMLCFVEILFNPFTVVKEYSDHARCMQVTRL